MNNLFQNVRRLLLFGKQLWRHTYARLVTEINTPPKALYPLDEEEMEELEQHERKAEWERQQRPKGKS